MLRKWLNLLFVIVLAFGIPAAVSAQDGVTPQEPDTDVSGLLIPDGDVIGGDVIEEPVAAAELQQASGRIQIVVRLVDAPLARAVGPNAKQRGSQLRPNQQRQYLAELNRKQDELLARIAALGGIPLGKVGKALNAVMVEVDASQIPAIAALPNVHSIRPLINFEKDLSNTVPYIGAATVQAAGVDGSGVRVAVLDSGIDYTHFNLGGSGNVADFINNDPTAVEPGSFPTLKVIGGYDFVGEAWPNGPLAADPDPLDKGPGAGHGTHVADIIGGKSMDGSHIGVAPGALLYAVGVCSKVSTSCSGQALLEGMDFALDPNGDGDISDAVDVVNMSLGSPYGQRQDDLSAASANAVRMGVVVVTSAGNSGDKPFIVGSPSSTPEVISVAQTAVPGVSLYRIIAGTASAVGSWQPWSAAPVTVSGPLVYDASSTGTALGCTDANGTNPWTGTPLAGKVLLVDRGTCAVSFKVANGAAAGAVAVVVANNVAQPAGDLPPDFSYGGGSVTVAGYTITRADGALLKGQLGQVATIDISQTVSLAGAVVSTSSRGPSVSYSAIKPDIGAPGASVSAVYGTGNGQAAFSGTSGAAPMVTGSAALLLQKFPGMTPPEVKARLMNTAETNIVTNPILGNLAPVSRIGGGEVRVDRAAAATTSAWDADHLTGSLSFGYQALTGTTSFRKTVVVYNYDTKSRTYQITPTFRYGEDEASGAVTVSAPSSITVPANSSRSFNVRLRVDVAKLPVWNLNGGALGGNGASLQPMEFDGYINISDDADTVHVAWQILPHRAAEVTLSDNEVSLSDGAGSLTLTNTEGAANGTVDVFSLLGTSGRIPPPLMPEDGDNYALIDLKNFGARLVSAGGQPAVQFAMSTFGIQAHPNYPAGFEVDLDTNRDGTPDYAIYNEENGGFAVSGQGLVFVQNLNTGQRVARFYTDASLESGNVIFTALLSDLGLTPGTTFDATVYAYDNYFTGWVTDVIGSATYTLGAPRFTTSSGVSLAPGQSATLNITANPANDTLSPSQLGFLLMYRDSRSQREADAVIVK